MSRNKLYTTVYINGIEFYVEATTYPAYKGARDSFNGRMGAGIQLEPDEPGGIELDKITLPPQDPIDFEDLVSITHERIEQAVMEDLEDDDYE